MKTFIETEEDIEEFIKMVKKQDNTKQLLEERKE